MKKVRIANQAGQTLFKHVCIASTLFSRLRGLLGKRQLPPEQGLLLTPCNSVHTIGMSFPIDVIFLDGRNRIIRICSDVPPGRLRWGTLATRKVLELSAGAAREKRLAVQDQLNWSDHE